MGGRWAESAPPEADGEAGVQRAQVVPAPGRNVEHLPSMEDELGVLGMLKQRKGGEVWTLHLHLQYYCQHQNYKHKNVGTNQDKLLNSPRNNKI